MAYYFCSKCQEKFHSQEININLRHDCGNYARLDWEAHNHEESEEGLDHRH